MSAVSYKVSRDKPGATRPPVPHMVCTAFSLKSAETLEGGKKAGAAQHPGGPPQRRGPPEALICGRKRQHGNRFPITLPQPCPLALPQRGLAVGPVPCIPCGPSWALTQGTCAHWAEPHRRSRSRKTERSRGYGRPADGVTWNLLSCSQNLPARNA